jgi:hypothetical protein
MGSSPAVSGVVSCERVIAAALCDSLVRELASLRSGGRWPKSTPAHRSAPKSRPHPFLTYLNDDFDGGGTRFTASGREIRPEAGMGVLFDAALAHSGEPVLHGRKYALVTWLRRESIP